MVVSQDRFPLDKLTPLLQEDFGDEIIKQGSECLYLYLLREAKKKRLYTNYLEKRLNCAMTARKLSVIHRLLEMVP